MLFPFFYFCPMCTGRQVPRYGQIYHPIYADSTDISIELERFVPAPAINTSQMFAGEIYLGAHAGGRDWLF